MKSEELEYTAMVWFNINIKKKIIIKIKIIYFFNLHNYSGQVK